VNRRRLDPPNLQERCQGYGDQDDQDGDDQDRFPSLHISSFPDIDDKRKGAPGLHAAHEKAAPANRGGQVSWNVAERRYAFDTGDASVTCRSAACARGRMLAEHRRKKTPTRSGVTQWARLRHGARTPQPRAGTDKAKKRARRLSPERPKGENFRMQNAVKGAVAPITFRSCVRLFPSGGRPARRIVLRERVSDGGVGLSWLRDVRCSGRSAIRPPSPSAASQRS
jgi:hypothetical protein